MIFEVLFATIPTFFPVSKARYSLELYDPGKIISFTGNCFLGDAVCWQLTEEADIANSIRNKCLTDCILKFNELVITSLFPEFIAKIIQMNTKNELKDNTLLKSQSF